MYAKYYDASSYARLLDDYSNKSVQIGIVTTMDESGYIRILEVYPDSPAQGVLSLNSLKVTRPM